MDSQSYYEYLYNIFKRGIVNACGVRDGSVPLAEMKGFTQTGHFIIELADSILHDNDEGYDYDEYNKWKYQLIAYLRARSSLSDTIVNLNHLEKIKWKLV